MSETDPRQHMQGSDDAVMEMEEIITEDELLGGIHGGVEGVDVEVEDEQVAAEEHIEHENPEAYVEPRKTRHSERLMSASGGGAKVEYQRSDPGPGWSFFFMQF